MRELDWFNLLVNVQVCVCKLMAVDSAAELAPAEQLVAGKAEMALLIIGLGEEQLDHSALISVEGSTLVVHNATSRITCLRQAQRNGTLMAILCALLADSEILIALSVKTCPTLCCPLSCPKVWITVPARPCVDVAADPSVSSTA